MIVFSQFSKVVCFQCIVLLGGEGRYSFILFYGSFFPAACISFFVFSLSLSRLLKVLLFYPFYCEKHSFLGLPVLNPAHLYVPSLNSQCADLLTFSPEFLDI